ncbi:MAG: hypothetical protein HXY46_00475 [Syntrophaceae bacterium]|nr:hypothetical protein [Syntrophaceae bacterium]
MTGPPLATIDESRPVYPPWLMKTLAEKRLFWFLKEGAELDLPNKAHLDIFIQQTLSKAKTFFLKK